MTDQATFVNRDASGFRVVEAHGEFDLSNAGDLRVALETSFEGTDVLIVSLAGVSYLDSSALGVLIQASRRADMQRRKLHLVAPRHGPAGKLLRIAAVDQIAPLSESVDDAIAILTPLR